MNRYITGAFIKKLRESKGLTQKQLAEKIFVSEKTISKWETGKGYPDISLLESLSESLGVSVIELMSGNNVVNSNRSFNMKRSKFYICPICGNIVFSAGEAVISCCGITLVPEEAESSDGEHILKIENVEDEIYFSSPHSMTKNHYISFIAAVSDNGCEIIKLYPEGNCEARIKRRRLKYLYFFCNRHGLFRAEI